MRNIVLLSFLLVLSSCSKSYVSNLNKDSNLEVIAAYNTKVERLEEVRVLRFQKDSLYVLFKSGVHKTYPCNYLIVKLEK